MISPRPAASRDIFIPASAVLPLRRIPVISRLISRQQFIHAAFIAQMLFITLPLFIRGPAVFDP